MGMVLNNKRSINNVHPKIAREIARICKRSPRSINLLANKLSVDNDTMEIWVNSLFQAGFLEKDQVASDNWIVTRDGFLRLSDARFGKPLTGRQLSSLAVQIIDRAKAYNSTSRFPYWITDINLFGPFLNQPLELDDLYIAVSAITKPEFETDTNWKFRYCTNYGPNRPLTIVDQLFFAENELCRYLTNSNRKIALYIQDIRTLTDKWATIYQKDDANSLDAHVMSKDEIIKIGENIDQIRSETLNNEHQRLIMPSSEKIALFWLPKLKQYGIFEDIDTALYHCWRCNSRRRLERCHIMPSSLGGKDHESNLVLLCSRCHTEGPNVADSEVMWDWILSYRENYQNDFWNKLGEQEYKQIYGRSIQEDVTLVVNETNTSLSSEEIKQLFASCVSKAKLNASVHFSQPFYNHATMAGIFHMALKEFSETLRRSAK